ncbi:MAG TPA: hypothetical protein VGU20_08990 [Stellaceae bacterium]|nr:hypothetical protein [Stellaceae bacterium]
MHRILLLAAITVAGTVLVTLPALAAHKHAASCYDYAWESQDLKDCLAGKPMHQKMGATHACMHETDRHCPMMKQMRRHDMPMNKS